MVVNRVMAVGFVLTAEDDRGDSLTVHCWTRLSGSEIALREDYEHLTYLEALDLIIAHADSNRPGWAVGDGWAMPPLPLGE